MPRLKSAIKRVQVSERNRVHNLLYKTQIRTLIKKVAELVSKKDSKSAAKTANEAFALIDRACTKNILHSNNAARKKSRISRWLKTIEPEATKSKS